MKQVVTENRLKYWESLKGKKLSPEHRLKVIKTLKPIRKGGTYEEAFGAEIAKQMKEKMSLAKIGKKMPWNKGFKGENHPRWKKDRSLIVGRHNRNFHDPEYKKWRKEILLRDNFKCKISNRECNGRLEVHHIVTWKESPELRYQVNNGIALCHAHHPRKRAEEKRLEDFFKQLIN